MQRQVAHISRSTAPSAKRFLVTDLDNTLIDSRARFNRAVGEATGYPLTATPQLSSVKSLTKEQRNKFYEIFLSGKYMDLDVPVRGSVEVLNYLRSISFGIIYLTGRHHTQEESLRDETITTFSRYGYPMPDRTNVMLYMKPNKMSSTHEYKRGILERLGRSMDLAVGVDDEADDLRAMADNVSLVIGVYLSSQSYRDISSKIKIPLAKDWLEVKSIMKQRRVIQKTQL